MVDKLCRAGIFVALVLVLGIAGSMVYQTDTVLDRVLKAENALQIERDQAVQVAEAQAYATPLVQSVQLLSEENASLMAREQAAAKVVAGLQQESKLLKTSLKEAVEKIKEMSVGNNDLMREIEQLQYKVDALEAALKAINSAPAPAAAPAVIPMDPPKVAARYHTRSRVARFFSRVA